MAGVYSIPSYFYSLSYTDKPSVGGAKKVWRSSRTGKFSVASWTPASDSEGINRVQQTIMKKKKRSIRCAMSADLGDGRRQPRRGWLAIDNGGWWR